MPTDKLSKIDKIEGNKKAQAVIKKASNSANSKSTIKAKPKPSKMPKPKVAKKPVSKEAAKNLAKKAHKKSTIFALGVLNASEKKIAKIEAFFAKFIKNAKDKNEFIEAAILRHIKKCKKKFNKN